MIIEKIKTFQVNLPIELHRQWRERAEDEGKRMNDLIVEALKKYLAKEST